MSFPTLQVRPNEKNPKVLRAHEFLRQSNQLVERNIVNSDGRKLLAKLLSKMVAEVKAIYALDDKRTESGKSAKLLEKLKTMQESATSVQEDRFVIAELQRKVLENKIENQKLISEIESCRSFVHSTKAEVQREKEKLDERKKVSVEATKTLKYRSSSILKHLEASEEGENLRKTEEEKRILEEEVEAMRATDRRLKDQIRTNRAILKAESKKSFKNTVIECAKHYKLCQTLTPKLQKSQRNVEALKEEEERRKASGSLDDTVLFDRSFVLASMEKDQPKTTSVPLHVHNSPIRPTVQAVATPPSLPKAAPTRLVPDVVIPVQPVAVDEPTPEVQVDSAPVEPSVQEEERTMEESREEEVPMEVPEPMEVHESIEDNHENSTINMSDISGNVTIHEEAPESESGKSSESSKNVSMETQRVAPQTETQEEEEVAEVGDKDHSIDVMEQDDPEEEAQPMEVDPPAVKSSQTAATKPPADSFSFNFFNNSPNKEAENSGSGGNKSNDFDFGNIFGDMGGGGGDDGSNNGSAFEFLGGGNETSNADPFGFGSTSGGAPGAGDSSFNFNFGGAGEESSGNDNGGNFFNF